MKEDQRRNTCKLLRRRLEILKGTSVFGNNLRKHKIKKIIGNKAISGLAFNVIIGDFAFFN